MDLAEPLVVGDRVQVEIEICDVSGNAMAECMQYTGRGEGPFQNERCVGHLLLALGFFCVASCKCMHFVTRIMQHKGVPPSFILPTPWLSLVSHATLRLTSHEGGGPRAWPVAARATQ
jgi:hypothetical protein